MSGKIAKAFELLGEPRVLRVLFTIRFQSFLEKAGWFKAFTTNSSVDANGNPLPWLSYPFIRFIEKRLSKELDLFEFGSGNSTLYYAARVRTVMTVEHDKEWFEKIRQSVPGNVSILFKSLETGEEYVSAAAKSGKSFDIVIVDGRERVRCVKSNLSALNERGVLILDDSERVEYADGIVFLRQQGFSQIDFWGISPGCLDEKCTTVFYRSENCFGI